jgi:hypothetical protein
VKGATPVAQIVGNSSRGTTGIQLGLGPAGVGQMLVLMGQDDPNGINDASDLNPGVNSAAVGSLYLRAGVGLYVKSALPNTWTAK